MTDRDHIENCLRTFDAGYSHFIRKTPLWQLPGKALGVDCAQVWLKLEHLQTGGSFEVVVTGAAYADALKACLARQLETGALLTHAYDQPEVLAGAGTMAAEIEQQGGVPDSVLVSVGGGGLIGGVAGWFEQRSRVVALEPELAPTLYKAREAGEPVDVAVSGIAADSLGAKRIGSLSWEVTQAHVRDALLLSDESIRAAQLWLWKELKLAVEPAAALPLAAMQSGRYRPRADEKVCLIICGANLDPASLN
jgi:threonine dehydratase